MADKISVAMCTWNGERYLPDQLASFAAQTRPPDELIVCDDNSSDATVNIVSQFTATAPFPVRLHVNEQNLGSTKNFERAIGFCTGDIVALADQDDVWLPEKLRRIEDCFQRERGAGLVFTDAEVVDERLQPLGYSLWESVGFNDVQRRLVRSGRVLDVLLPGWTVTGATMAFRSNFKNLVLDIPTNLPLIHDGWIALMIASVAEVVFIEERLIKYRQHAGQQIGARERKARAIGDESLGEVKKSTHRTNSYLSLIAILMHARQRLAERRASYETDQAIARLDDRLKHLRARACLPQEKLNRVRSIVTELLSQRYHRYSNGVYSALKDLFT